MGSHLEEQNCPGVVLHEGAEVLHPYPVRDPLAALRLDRVYSTSVTHGKTNGGTHKCGEGKIMACVRQELRLSSVHTTARSTDHSNT